MASQSAQQLDDEEDREDLLQDDGNWEPVDEEALLDALQRSLRDPVKLDAFRILDGQHRNNH